MHYDVCLMSLTAILLTLVLGVTIFSAVLTSSRDHGLGTGHAKSLLRLQHLCLDCH
jgi:hypothetical protein